MKITFKNLHKPKGTITATVLIDGKDVFSMIYKDGHSGCELTPLRGKKELAEEVLRAKATRGASFLDVEVAAALATELIRREMNKATEKNVVFVRGGRIEKRKILDGESLIMWRAYLKKHCPKAVVLNDIKDEEERLALWIKNSK